MASKTKFDAIVLGGGMVGLTQALALAQHGLEVAVVERAADIDGTGAFDGRVSAINAGGWAMLDALGVAEHLGDDACAIERIRVNDRLRPGTLTFAPEPGEEPLGRMVANSGLQAALARAVRATSGITLFTAAQIVETTRDDPRATVRLADNQVLDAPLLVAADGRSSSTRDRAGIALTRWSYGHDAVVTVVGFGAPHHGTAYQIFHQAGPLAILPMADAVDGTHRAAIVWTVEAGKGAKWAALSDRQFGASLAERMGGFLGPLTLLAPRQSWPLGFHYSARLIAPRLALVGDAGHGIHPIAGQGLNLGLRDVAALTECLVDGARTGLDPGDWQLLQRYDRWRGLDHWLVAAASDLFTRFFGLPGDNASALRRFGFGVVDKLPPLKRRIMTEARGQSGELPRLLLGEMV